MMKLPHFVSMIYIKGCQYQEWIYRIIFSLVLFRIDKEIEYVRNYLKLKNKIELGSKQDFTKPYIIKDPDNKNKTLIICDLEP